MTKVSFSNFAFTILHPFVKQEHDASPACFPTGTNEVIEVLDSNKEALALIAPVLDSDHESNGDIVVKQEWDASPAHFPDGTNEVIEVKASKADHSTSTKTKSSKVSHPSFTSKARNPSSKATKAKATKSVTSPSPPKATTPPPKLPKQKATKLVTPPSPPKATTPPLKLPKQKFTKLVTPPSLPKAATPPPKLPNQRATKLVTPPSPPKATTPLPKLHSVDNPKFTAFLETMPDDEKEQYIEDCTTVSLLKLMGDKEQKLFAFIGFSGLGLETIIKEQAKN
ncbi:hypothetical protein BT96DRAFT_994615 [Gymnopus androsaceus JB14]|uniref:Uncharacterized protein n=1 Tax=Gymnopus androsaceus JB14 TaxID=1447944 RepID=A0A6A4HM54_9AGAR|nr:hypothetical protein BT96DRAFT_994615 [Gymnopus androsaceus JB14]